ncbi:acyl-CoA/acyl-ACP dehydrogenase [Nocardioides anomalus]|uniref:Acyl-CoA/acyl-ACP dehydrogenase n=1 Tax=Nocardioides anomalus TaxID=2712223 RepID=A0A6G6WCF7_9ACTN|nr:acyl-CoA dehydrogenase family protein [Nocardioides anomalus]QIG42837.1 acyl-CoA/acyl-ACP dehydrogenase [Nocardioides anomalus]
MREVTRAHLATLAPATTDERVLDPAAPLDRAAWRSLATGLGLPGVRVPEDLGGAGLDRTAELVVHEELGRALYDGPLLGTLQVAAALLELTDDPVNRQRLRAIAGGELVAVPAMPVEETFPLLYPDAERTGDRIVLTGSLPCVVDAQVADALLVLAEHEGFHAYFWVRTDDPGVRVLPLPTLDLTRRMASVVLTRAVGELVAEQDRARAAVAAVRQGTALALAAECVGVADRCLEMTVEHLKVRRQFGREIGSFQALKHRCADLLVELETARSALAIAVRAVETNDLRGRRPESLAGLAVARTRCGRAAFHIARETVHLHGGTGYTWEHPAHLYLRRATSDQALLDSTGQQARLLATSVLATLHAEATA